MTASSEVSAGVRGVVAIHSRSESSMAPGYPDAISASCSPLRANDMSPTRATTKSGDSDLDAAKKGIQVMPPQGRAAMPMKSPIVAQPMPSFFLGAQVGPLGLAPTAAMFTPQPMMMPMAAQGSRDGNSFGGVQSQRNSMPPMMSQQPSSSGTRHPTYYVPQDEPVTELKPGQVPSLGMTPTYLTSKVRAFEARPGIIANSSIVLMPPVGTALKDFQKSQGQVSTNRAKEFEDENSDEGGLHRRGHRRHRHSERRGRSGARGIKQRETSEKSRHDRHSSSRRRRHHRHRRDEDGPDYSRDAHHQRLYTGMLTNSDDWDSTKERVECRCKCSHCRKGDGRCSYSPDNTKRGRRSGSVKSSSSFSSNSSSSSSSSRRSYSSSGSSSYSNDDEEVVRRAPRGSGSLKDKKNSANKKNRDDGESGKRRGVAVKSQTPSRNSSRSNPVEARNRDYVDAKGSSDHPTRKEKQQHNNSRRSGGGQHNLDAASSSSSCSSEEAKFFPPQLTHHYFHHYPSLPSKKTNPFPQQGAVPLRREGFQMPEGNVSTMHHFPISQKGAASYKTGFPANPATHKQPFDNFRIATFEIPESEHGMPIAY